MPVQAGLLPNIVGDLPEDARIPVLGLDLGQNGRAGVLLDPDDLRMRQEDGHVVVDVLHDDDQRLRDEVALPQVAICQSQQDLVLGGELKKQGKIR